MPQTLTLASRSPNVRLVGPPRIETGSLVTAGFRSGRVPALLAYLSLRPGVEVHREEIAAALWPRLAPEAARNNLRVTLRYLKQALEAHGLEGGLRADDRAHLWLDPEVLVSDVERFGSLAREGRDEEALALAGAEFLAGLHDEWTLSHRATFEATRAGVLVRLAERTLAADPARALEHTRRGLADDPLSDAARGLAARALLRLGDPQAAVRELEDHRNELGGTLPPQLARLLDEARRGPSPAPAPIPVARTRFYGRAAELEGVRAWLGGGDRLMTVFGPGGIGKSRLGAEAVGRFAGDLAVLWVDATGATRADVLLDLVVGRLGPVGPAPGGALDQIITALHGRRALLVLDNLETMPDEEIPAVDDLLNALPLAQALCLSRKTLGLAGERTLRLDPLPLPQAPEDVSAPALALLLDRASGVESDADLVALAHELEGIPLAIELAAAKTSILSVPELLAGMQDRLDVLVGRSSKHARHRTMRATLDWSFDLLDPTMRDALLDLAILRDGWTLDAAQALGDGGDLAATRETVEMGCTNSLLIRSGAGGESRYRMLQCTRDYALETLAPSRRACLRARHAAHYRAVAERGLTMAQAEREEGNLRAALEWLAETPGDGRGLVAFAEARVGGWTESSVGRGALRTIEAVDRTGFAPELRARLNVVEVRLRLSVSDYEGALTTTTSGLAESPTDDLRSSLLALRCWALAVLGRSAEAEAASREAVDAAPEAFPRRVAEARLVRAFVELSDLDPAALGTALAALAIAESIDDPVLIGRILDLLGLVYFRLGDLASAEAAFARSEALPLDPTPVRQARRWISRAQVAITAGDIEAGRDGFARALEHARTAAHTWSLCQSLAQLGDAETQLGRFAEGRAAHQEAHDIRLRTGELHGLASCLRGLGMASHGLGDHERALAELSEARRIAEETNDDFFLATVLLPYIRAARAADRDDRTAEGSRSLMAVCDRLALRPELARELDLDALRAEAQATLDETER